MKKILVIDDDKFFPITLKEALDSKKYEIFTAEDGKAGLEAVENIKPDAILLDINMPGMTGLDFLEILNKKPGFKNSIPILITSNLAGMNTVSQGISLGVRGYIVKSDESLETISTAVDNLFWKK